MWRFRCLGNRIERGLAVLVGMVIMYFSTLVGLAVGFIGAGGAAGQAGLE